MSYVPKQAFVVSHTHWDREWYRTFHSFRIDLNRIVKQVLDLLEADNGFNHFLLDGQTAVLEDYLEIHPEDAGRIRSLSNSGKLSLGPWYILPDEFLVSEEAHVRNLIYGHRVAEQYGKVQKVGYMPDSFGHVAQMPQILKQAGIDSFIYTRGNGSEIDDTGFEYRWRAPDGSSVLTINQCGGYCNAAGLGHEEFWHAHTRRETDSKHAVKQVQELFDKLGERSNGDLVLLNNGCDHFPPQQDFDELFTEIRKSFPDTEFIHTSLQEYVDAVNAAGIAKQDYEGELLGGRLHHILSGVWSARTYLKQLNDECQTLLADNMEPLAASMHFCQGHDYPSGLIEYNWKTLLKNHPHDSICGCSTDEVHEDMLPRFACVKQAAHQYMVEKLRSLSPTFARQSIDDRETILCVFNPLPFKRTAIVERLVVLQPFGIHPSRLVLLDEEGNEVPFEILHRWQIDRFWGVDYRTLLFGDQQLNQLSEYLDELGERINRPDSESDTSDCFLRIQFEARDLPGVGHHNYRLTEKPADSPPYTAESELHAGNGVLENMFCRVEVHNDGSFDLTDKTAGRSYRNLNLLESTEDIGDEYDYSPGETSLTVSSKGIDGKLGHPVLANLRSSVKVRFALQLPASIAADRKQRCSELVDCPVQFTISLDHNSPVVNISLELSNNAKDHRLRALFPGLADCEYVVSDGHFQAARRPIEPPASDNWVQPHPGTIPQQRFSVLEGDSAGVAVFNRGLHELEVIQGHTGDAGLALTLLRSVGWLSRDDFRTRRCSNAGPMMPTPAAQCQGKQTFSYAVVPYSGSWVTAGIDPLSRSWATPCPVIQGVEDQSISGAGLLECVNGNAVVTAIKKHETRDTLVVRMYNPENQPTSELLQLGRDIDSAWMVNLLEKQQQNLDITDCRLLEIKLAPYAITTIEVQFAAH